MKIIGLFILKCDGEQPIFLSTAYDLSFARFIIKFIYIITFIVGIKDFL